MNAVYTLLLIFFWMTPVWQCCHSWHVTMEAGMTQSGGKLWRTSNSESLTLILLLLSFNFFICKHIYQCNINDVPRRMKMKSIPFVYIKKIGNAFLYIRAYFWKNKCEQNINFKIKAFFYFSSIYIVVYALFIDIALYHNTSFIILKF